MTLAVACVGGDQPVSGSARPHAPATERTADKVDTTACPVTDSSMGPVRLGMTLAEARGAMPGATFERVYDGEGVGSVGVISGRDSLMVLTAEGDEDEKIDWSKPVTFIETFSPRCSTVQNVHPGALVRDVEQSLGKVTGILLSEIESRQFIRFERQPAGLTLRLDYTGIFPDGERETLRFEPDARIFSIAIAR